MNTCFYRPLSLLLILCLCALQSQRALAIACSDIFTNGIQAHGASGNIRLDYHSIITGGSATLTARTLTDNTTWLACSGSSCVATGTAATKSTPTFLTGNGANGAISVGAQASVTRNSGNYTTVNVGQEGTLIFNSAAGDYRTGAVTTNFKSILRLQSGDYWIHGNLTIGQETVLRRIASSGPTRIFVNGNVSFGFKVSTDGFSSNQLLIYATGSITSVNELDFTGYLYAGGNVSLGFLSTVNGAVSGANFIGAGNEVTINYQGSNLSSADFSPFCSGATVVPVLLGSWNMDEGSWNGTANEVRDSSGKGNHGRARIAAGSTPLPSTGSGGPAYINGNQNTCYYGAFDGTGSPLRSRTYVELTGFPALPLGFTFAAWIRSSNASAQHQRILVRDDAQNGWGFSLADGTGQPKLRFFGRNITNNGAVTGQGSNPSCGVFCLDTNAVISSNQWHYVAAVVDTTAKTVTLYVYSQARVLLAKTTAAYSGTWSDGTGLAAIGGETSASAEGQDPSWHFLGNIDEVNIYSGALTQTNIETLMQTVRTCAGPDHYEVQISAQSLACEGAVVTVRACANSAVPCNKDSSVSANVTLGTNAGSLNSTGLTLVAGEATTKLLYPAAIENAGTTLTLSGETIAANNSRKCCTGPSNCSVANTCSTVFKRAGFIFSSNAAGAINIPTQIAGVTDNSVYLRSVKSDDATGACVARFTSPQTVQLGYQCSNPVTCIAGQTLSLAGAGVASNANAIADGSISYTNRSLTFGSNGSAPIALNYSDVGDIRLHARLALAAGGGEPAYTMTGISNYFVVKPHTLAVSAVTNAANVATPGTTSSGAGFIPAGEKFKVLVQARNAAGNPTPNFGKEKPPSEIESVTVSANTLVYPAAGTLTALTNGGVFTATTPAGTFVNPDVQWNQVGSISILPNLIVAPGNNGYLEQGAIPNVASGTVGRFYPDKFDLQNTDSITTCNGFIYMGMPFNVDSTVTGTRGLDFTVRALDKQNNPVTNYDFAKGYAVASTPFFLFNAANNFLPRLTNNSIAINVPAWVNGVVTINEPNAQFARAAAPDGPHSAVRLGIGVQDCLDKRPLAGANLTVDTTGGCGAPNNNAYELAIFNARFGRLRLDDAFGPETANLPVTFSTEYWTGSSFIRHVEDSCTKILRSAITYPSGDILTPANLTVGLSGGSTAGNYGGLGATEIAFTNGDAAQFFSAPIGGGTGSFNVNVDLTSYPWLRFDWNQDGNFTDVSLPQTQFGFGSYRGHDRVIYWRELFN